MVTPKVGSQKKKKILMSTFRSLQEPPFISSFLCSENREQVTEFHPNPYPALDKQKLKNGLALVKIDSETTVSKN